MPNRYGGRENLEAIEFLRAVNDVGRARRRRARSRSPRSRRRGRGVTRPIGEGGLGFTFKWNMGWMHDTLGYFAREPVHRKLPPRPAHVRDALRVQRALHHAALARRGRARQGLAAREDAGRPLAEAREPARCCSPTSTRGPARSSCSWAPSSRRTQRVEPRREPRLAPRATIRARQAFQRFIGELGRVYRDARLRSGATIHDPRRLPAGSTAPTATTRSSRTCAATAATHVVVVLNLTPVPRERLPHRRARAAGATSSCLSSDDGRFGGSGFDVGRTCRPSPSVRTASRSRSACACRRSAP